jgi:nitroreductase
MNNFLNLAVTRRSIRKYQDTDVPVKDIEYFIKAAVSAPSGCNSQCWRFIAVKDKEIIKRMEKSVIGKIEKLLEGKKAELPQEYLSSKKKMACFFSNAPLVIAVFMTDTYFYDKTFISALEEQGYDKSGIMDLFANYDILSIGAAVQNLLLAVHEKGYGACWMNEPSVAGDEINSILGVPKNERFMSLIPIGKPAYIPREKNMKELSEVFTIK